MSRMRLTIGERLGMLPDRRTTRPFGTNPEHAVPSYVEPEVAGPTIDLGKCLTSPVPWGEVPEPIDDGGPPRVRGEMVWLHKTAPTLVIEGRPDVSPEEHAAGRRR